MNSRSYPLARLVSQAYVKSKCNPLTAKGLPTEAGEDPRPSEALNMSRPTLRSCTAPPCSHCPDYNMETDEPLIPHIEIHLPDLRRLTGERNAVIIGPVQTLRACLKIGL